MAIMHASPVLLLPCRSNLEEIAPSEARCVVSDSQQSNGTIRYDTKCAHDERESEIARCEMLRCCGEMTYVLYVPVSPSVSRVLLRAKNVQALGWLLDLHVRKLPCRYL